MLGPCMPWHPHLQAFLLSAVRSSVSTSAMELRGMRSPATIKMRARPPVSHADCRAILGRQRHGARSVAAALMGDRMDQPSSEYRMNVIECDVPPTSMLSREFIERAYFRDAYRAPLS